MTPQTKFKLDEILNSKPWEVRPLLMKFMETVEIIEDQTLRTDNQHNALFLWFSQIEKEAERQGITWDVVIKYTHQLRITKSNLHSMCKDLQKALWNTDSTKKLKKREQLDIIIDHFIDLLGSKVGMELPPFPNDPNKLRPLIEAMKLAEKVDYPEYSRAPEF